jgi:predicted nucleic acid-binding protein
MSDERVVFDTEPLVAYLLDEEGAESVGEYLDRVVEGSAVSFVSPVTLTEVHYISHYYGAQQSPDDLLGELQASGVNQVKASVCWRDAARYKREYQVALGDAYSLATAAHVDGTLLVGADDDFDGVEDVDMVRFRENSA